MVDRKPWEKYGPAPAPTGPWTKYQPSPQAPAALPAEFADLPVPGYASVPQTPPPQPQLQDIIMRGAANIAGLPVDAVNSVLNVPSQLGMNAPAMSAEPFMGSDSIYGMLQGMTGSEERQSLARTNPDLNLSGEGVDPWKRFLYGNMATPEAQRLFMENNYGAENEGWYTLADMFGNPTNRTVVRTDGGETLFNPPGLDWGDAAEMGAMVPGTVGGVAGGFASLPAYVAGPVVGGVASALASTFGYEAVDEAVKRLFEENRQAEPDIIGDVLPRAAQEGLVDLIMGGAMGAGLSLANKAKNVVTAPFARSASDPLATEYRDAAGRLREQGYDINPLASEEGAGGFVPRMEGILEKLPGSAEAMQAHRELGDAEISRFQQDMVGGANPNVAGRNAVSDLQGQQDALIANRDARLSGVDDQLAQRQTDLTTRQGPDVSAQQAGSAMRSGFEQRREQFRTEANTLYNTARNMPGGQDPIVSMAGVKGVVADIRDNLPPDAMRTETLDTGLLDASGRPITREVQTGGDASSQFTPDGLKRFLTGVDDIADNITPDQARQMRVIVDDALENNNVLPGVPEHYLGQLRSALTRAMDEAPQNAGNQELADALSAANNFYRDNIDQFHRKGVANVFRGPTQPGFTEDNQLVQRLLAGRGNPGLIASTRNTLGADSPQWAATRRNAMEQILDTGRNKTLYGRNVVDVDNFIGRLNQLDDEVLTELFGVADAQQLRNLAVDISNRTKYLDADALSTQGDGNILAALQGAAADNDALMREYRNDVIGPFLRDEAGAAAKVNSDELVPWLYRSASPDDIRLVMGKLSPERRSEVERGVVADIVESAIAKSQDGIQAVRRLVSGETAPASGDDIAAIMGVGGDSAARQQQARIAELLPPEVRQNLQDLAVITARRQERDATTSAVGGLAAGAAVSGMMRDPVTAASSAVNARIVAAIVTSPGFRKWVTNTRRTSVDPTVMAGTIAISPPVMKAMGGTLSEFSQGELQAAADWLNSGVSQLNEAGERDISVPSGFSSWTDYFNSGAQ